VNGLIQLDIMGNDEATLMRGIYQSHGVIGSRYKGRKDNNECALQALADTKKSTIICTLKTRASRHIAIIIPL
jgi:hypothetical protein